MSDFKKKGEPGKFEDGLRRGVEIIEDTENHQEEAVEAFENAIRVPEESGSRMENEAGTERRAPVKAWREAVSKEELEEPLDDGFFDEEPMAAWMNEDRAERLGLGSVRAGKEALNRSEAAFDEKAAAGGESPDREEAFGENAASSEAMSDRDGTPFNGENTASKELSGRDEVEPDGEAAVSKEISDQEKAAFDEETDAGEGPLDSGATSAREVQVPEQEIPGGQDAPESSAEAEEGGRRSRSRQSRKHREPRIKQEQPAASEPAGEIAKGQEPDGETAKSQEPAAEKEPGQKKSGKKKAALIAAAVIAAILLIGGGAYAAIGQKYKTAFFPNTQINGLDVSGKSLEEVKSMIASGVEGYVLTIEERGGRTEQIIGKEIGLRPEFDGTLEEVLARQNPYAWLSYQLDPATYTIDTMIVYDKAVLEEKIKLLECADPTLMKEPEDARVSDYVQGQGFSIVPEVEGTVLSEEALKRALSDAIVNLKESVSLEEAGVYKEPAIRQDDETLKAKVAELNQYANITITYKFGDKTEVLGGDRIREWLITDEAGNVTVDPVQTAKYVEELAAVYNTSNKSKTFKTSSGPVIEVKGGTYGWKINQAQEAEELAAVILSGESQEREPVYSQKAASHGENDYGDTYVEINLTAQHLYFYKNGSLLVDSDFVSGNLSRGWGTPAGTYPLTYKQRNAILKGENYRTPVDYWMPFNGGIGMHDATWRSSFGGAIYKTGGSHGCINLPHSVAKQIYENISGGMPVICYNLAGTEQKGSSSAAPPPAATEAPVETPTEAPAEIPGQIPAEPPAPTEAPAPAPAPETTAPAGPGSDTNPGGSASGPGSEIR